METSCVIFTTFPYRSRIEEGIENPFFNHCSLFSLMLGFLLMNMYQTEYDGRGSVRNVFLA
jgi:hypothetical protein